MISRAIKTDFNFSNSKKASAMPTRISIFSSREVCSAVAMALTAISHCSRRPTARSWPKIVGIW